MTLATHSQVLRPERSTVSRGPVQLRRRCWRSPLSGMRSRHRRLSDEPSATHASGAAFEARTIGPMSIAASSIGKGSGMLRDMSYTVPC